LLELQLQWAASRAFLTNGSGAALCFKVEISLQASLARMLNSSMLFSTIIRTDETFW